MVDSESVPEVPDTSPSGLSSTTKTLIYVAGALGGVVGLAVAMWLVVRARRRGRCCGLDLEDEETDSQGMKKPKQPEQAPPPLTDIYSAKM